MPPRQVSLPSLDHNPLIVATLHAQRLGLIAGVPLAGRRLRRLCRRFGPLPPARAADAVGLEAEAVEVGVALAVAAPEEEGDAAVQLGGLPLQLQPPPVRLAQPRLVLEGHSDYGAVAAAKAALESYIRQLAMELAPAGITANAILAGVTDTPALRQIPHYEKFIEVAKSGIPTTASPRPRTWRVVW